MIRIKDNLRVSILRNEIILVLPIIASVFSGYGYDCVVTCFDKGHKKDDPHTNGFAVDLRTKHIERDSISKQIAAKIQEALGSLYYVQYEPDVWEVDSITGEDKQTHFQHIHVQVRKDIWPDIK